MTDLQTIQRVTGRRSPASQFIAACIGVALLAGLIVLMCLEAAR